MDYTGVGVTRLLIRHNYLICKERQFTAVGGVVVIQNSGLSVAARSFQLAEAGGNDRIAGSG